MVFTLLDRDPCMVYEPVVMQTHHFDTVHIHIEDGRVVSIREEDNLLSALGKLGMDLEPLFCGGRKDRWTSGAGTVAQRSQFLCAGARAGHRLRAQ